MIGWSRDAGLEFYLRDCVFNRGPKGAARILQRAVGVRDDGDVGPQTRSAVASIDAEQLLQRLRSAREQYERVVVRRNESSKFWRGLVNRWDNALATARKFSAEKAAPAQDKPACSSTVSAHELDRRIGRCDTLVVLQAEADRRINAGTRKTRGGGRPGRLRPAAMAGAGDKLSGISGAG